MKRLVQGPTGTYYAIRWMGRATKKSNRKFLEGLVHFRDEKDFTLEGLRANLLDQVKIDAFNATQTLQEWRDKWSYRWGRNDTTDEIYGYMSAPVFLGELGFSSDEIYGLREVSLHDPKEANYDVYEDANQFYVRHDPGKFFLSWNFTPLAVLKAMGWHALTREDVKIGPQTIQEYEEDNPKGFKSLFNEKTAEIQDFLGIRVEHWTDALLYLYAIRRMGREVPSEWIDRSYVLSEADYRTDKYKLNFPKDLPMFVAGSRLESAAKEEAANFVKRLEEDKNAQFVKNWLKVDLNEAPENVKINALLQMQKFYGLLEKGGPKIEIYNHVSDAWSQNSFAVESSKAIYDKFFGKLRDAKNYVDVVNAMAEERKTADEKYEGQTDAFQREHPGEYTTIATEVGIHLALAAAAEMGLQRILDRELITDKYRGEGRVPEVTWDKVKWEEYARLKNPLADTDKKLHVSMTNILSWVQGNVHPDMRTDVSVELISTRQDMGGDCGGTHIRITEGTADWFPGNAFIHEYGHAMDHNLVNKDNAKGEAVDDLFRSFFDWKTKG